MTAGIYGGLEEQAPMTSPFDLFSLQAISAQFVKYYGDRDSASIAEINGPIVLTVFAYKAKKGRAYLQIAAQENKLIERKILINT